MKNLPRNFPELSLFYKMLEKKIMKIKIEMEEASDDKEKIHIKMKMESYQRELNKIKEKFPVGFFDGKK